MRVLIFVILIVIARIIEAYRDAEAFEYPTDSRSQLWHIFKYPQYALWLSAGYLLSEYPFVEALIWLMVSLLIAGVVFEISLRLFRAFI